MFYHSGLSLCGARILKEDSDANGIPHLARRG